MTQVLRDGISDRNETKEIAGRLGLHRARQVAHQILDRHMEAGAPVTDTALDECAQLRADNTLLATEVERLRVLCGPLANAVVLTPTERNDHIERVEAAETALKDTQTELTKLRTAALEMYQHPDTDHREKLYNNDCTSQMR